MSDDTYTYLIDMIKLHKTEWSSNKPERVHTLNTAISLMEQSIKESNCNIIDRVINGAYTDINSMNGPTRCINAHDYMFIKTVFPNCAPVLAEKFIYTEDMHKDNIEALKNRAKRKLDAIPTKRVNDILAIQPYDVTCERVRGYHFTSYDFSHSNTAKWNTTYMLARVTSGTIDESWVIRASYAYPLYKLKLGYVSNNVTNHMSARSPKQNA